MFGKHNHQLGFPYTPPPKSGQIYVREYGLGGLLNTIDAGIWRLVTEKEMVDLRFGF